MGDYLDKIRRHYNFDSKETRDIIITILILGFCVALDDGSATFNIIYWSLNLINMILVVAFAVIVHISVQKLYALKQGFKAEHNFFFIGLFIAFALTIVSNGKLWYFLPLGGIIIYHMRGHRLGMEKYNVQYKELGLIAISGSIANILLALMFRFLSYLPLNEVVITKAIMINIAIAITTMLPIPKSNGWHMLFASKPKYILAMSGIILASVLMFVFNPIVTIICAAIVALLLMLAYMYFYEL